MTFQAFLTHLMFGAGLAVFSTMVTALLVQWRGLMDVPNGRSAHSVPIPRSGGIAVVVTFFLGLLALYLLADRAQLREPYFIGFAGATAAIALISLVDDFTQVGLKIKFLTQAGCAAILMGFGLVVEQLPIPFVGYVGLAALGYVVTLVWVIGLTNAFNFMDGLDGLAAGTAIIAGIFFALATILSGSDFVYLASYAVVAGAMGFLVFNYPPARIFLGDVGSQFLGFVFAALALIAAQYDRGHTSFLVMPLLLFHFIWDSFFTFGRRLRAGDPVTQGHRTHLYQLLNRSGWSHRAVSLLHWGAGIAQGVGALVMIQVPGDARLLVFVPFVAAEIVYTVVVMRRARRLGLLRREHAA